MLNYKKLKFQFGIVIVLISIVIFFVLFAIPFLSLNIKTKLALTPVLLVAAEVMFWLGIALIGKDVYLNFKARLKSGQYFGKKADPTKDPE